MPDASIAFIDEIFHNLRVYLVNKAIYVSDRRWRKSLKILQVSAYTNSKDVIDEWSCLLLMHFMWQTPGQFYDFTDWFIDELNLNVSATVKRIEKLRLVWEDKLFEDYNKYTHKTNMHGEKLYITSEGETTTQHERVSLA